MAEENPKSGKSKLLIIILLTVIACGASGLAVYLLMSKDSSAGERPAANEEPIVAPEPIFVKIGPMTVNLQSEAQNQHLLYTSLTLKVDNPETETFINKHMPEVHSRLLLLLSSKTAGELVSTEGKAALTEQILALFEEPITSPQPKLAISSVLFSEFIVQ